jgi:hypothetical protein
MTEMTQQPTPPVNQSVHGGYHFFCTILALYVISLMLPPLGNELRWRDSGAATFYNCITEQEYGMVTCWATTPNFTLYLGLLMLARGAWISAAFYGLFSLTVSILVIVLLSQDHDTPLDLGMGYYCWVASMGLLAVAGLFRRG